MRFQYILLVTLAFSPFIALSDVLISDLRVKAPVPGQSVTAAYFEIENQGEDLVTLLSVRSHSAEEISMHDHEMREGMMTMIKLESVELHAGEKVIFTEGGRHLMVYSPNEHTIESDEMEFIFEFSHGREIRQLARSEFLVPHQTEAIHHH